jgi:hypothetical protein
MEVSCSLHTLVALSQGKSPQYSLDRRLGGLQNQKLIANLVFLGEVLVSFE